LTVRVSPSITIVGSLNVVLSAIVNLLYFLLHV